MSRQRAVQITLVNPEMETTRARETQVNSSVIGSYLVIILKVSIIIFKLALSPVSVPVLSQYHVRS